VGEGSNLINGDDYNTPFGAYEGELVAEETLNATTSAAQNSSAC